MIKRFLLLKRHPIRLNLRLIWTTLERPNEIIENILVIPSYPRNLFPGILAQYLLPRHPKFMEIIMNIPNSSVGIFLCNNNMRHELSSNSTLRMDDIHDVGMLSKVVNAHEYSSSTLLIRSRGHLRVRIISVINDNPLTVSVSVLEDNEFDVDDPEIHALRLDLKNSLRNLAQQDIENKNNTVAILEQFDACSPGTVAEMVVGSLNPLPVESQQFIETVDVKSRLNQAHELVIKELRSAKLNNVKWEAPKIPEEKKTQSDLIEKTGEKRPKPKDRLRLQYQKRIEEADIPGHIVQVLDDEMQKLEDLEQATSEFHITNLYIDWLTRIPWNVFSHDTLDPKKASDILNKNHFGLEEVKKQILHFIAIGALRGQIPGKVLCFQGPPGVGKTSIGKCIAQALNRKYYRLSVGGMHDVSEIKGHRRTYVAAMPGKFVKILCDCGTSNPVILIDEIDKLSYGQHGSPSNALLEALDPSQNSKFMDQYCDVPIDLSKVIFLATANDVSTISAPLLDRMEVIQLSGYADFEKEQIAKNYIIPELYKNSGLEEKDLHITDEAFCQIIKEYSRESGVRLLKRSLEGISSAVALEKVSNPNHTTVIVNEGNLKSYLGPASRKSSRIYNDARPGVVLGLAWTPSGGCVLSIESIASGKIFSNHPQGSLKTTGQLGDVMNESSQIAWSFTKSFLRQLDPNNDFFETLNVHMHIPEGGIQKDGPSAGCTIATSLLSLALDIAVRQDIAMTGEITLHGKILSVGGIKEKCMAAIRDGIRHIILPGGNIPHYESLPQMLRDELTFHFVDDYKDIFLLVFPTKSEQPEVQ